MPDVAACDEYFLMLCVADIYNSRVFDVVDIFDVRSGAWTTAALSAARYAFAATSLSNDGIAMFAGGWGKSTLFL